MLVNDRTYNWHRWTSRIYLGVWEKNIEGTRQNHSVTSENRVLEIIIIGNHRKEEAATV